MVQKHACVCEVWLAVSLASHKVFLLAGLTVFCDLVYINVNMTQSV